MDAENMPRMHLVPDADDTNAPEGFTERVLQARLADFWRSFGPRKGAEYDVIVAEERCERFFSEFLPSLPSAFALQPNKEWDEHLPKLPLQRQVLHTNIFDSLCHNFRPALLQCSSHVQCLPKYKQVLLSSQRKALAVAALNMLKGVSALHAMMGGSHMRFTGIIFTTFEAAVLLVYLCLDPDFPGERGDSRPISVKADPLAAGMTNVTRDECTQAADEALGRLRMLAEVNSMAEVGARTLARLVGKVTRSPEMAQATEVPTQVDEAWNSATEQLADYSALDSLPGFSSVAPYDVSRTSWEALAPDFVRVSGL